MNSRHPSNRPARSYAPYVLLALAGVLGLSLGACSFSADTDTGPIEDRRCTADSDCGPSGTCDPSGFCNTVDTDTSVPDDTGGDTSTPEDTTTTDTNAPTDTGGTDTGQGDTGVTDTGTGDTGVSDTGVSDTGVADTGVADTGIADTGQPDAGCTNGRVNCGGMCVDTQTSNDHCGGCGIVCAQGVSCSGGECICNEDGQVCHLSLANVTDAECETMGPQGDRGCNLTCEAGFVDDNGDSSDGCEAMP